MSWCPSNFIWSNMYRRLLLNNLFALVPERGSGGEIRKQPGLCRWLSQTPWGWHTNETGSKVRGWQKDDLHTNIGQMFLSNSSILVGWSREKFFSRKGFWFSLIRKQYSTRVQIPVPPFLLVCISKSAPLYCIDIIGAHHAQWDRNCEMPVHFISSCVRGSVTKRLYVIRVFGVDRRSEKNPDGTRSPIQSEDGAIYLLKRVSYIYSWLSYHSYNALEKIIETLKS